MLRSRSLDSGVTPRRRNHVVLPEPGNPYSEYDVALGSLRRALDRLRLRRRSGGHIRLGFHFKSAGIGWLIPLLLHGAVLLRSPLWRGRTIEWGRSLWRCGALWRCRPPGLAWRPLCANLRRHYGRPLTTIFSDGSRSTRRSAFSGQGLVWIEGHQGGAVDSMGVPGQFCLWILNYLPLRRERLLIPLSTPTLYRDNTLTGALCK